MFNTLISLSSKHFTLTQMEHSTDLDLWERLSDGLMTWCLFIHQSNCVSHQPLKLCTLIAKRGRSDHHIQQAFNLRPRQTHKTKLGQDSSAGKMSDRKAKCNVDAALIPWCGNEFSSQSQLSVQILLLCLYNPSMPSHASTSVCMLKMPPKIILGYSQ